MKSIFVLVPSQLRFRLACSSRNFAFEKSYKYTGQITVLALPNSGSRMNFGFPKVLCLWGSQNFTPPSGKDDIRTLFHTWLKSSTKPKAQPTSKLDAIPYKANITEFKMSISGENKNGEGWSQLSQAYTRKMRLIIKQGKLPGDVEMNLFMALVEVFICLGNFKEAKQEVEYLDKYMQKVHGKSEADTGKVISKELTVFERIEENKINLYKAVIYAALDNKQDAKRFLDKYVKNIKAATEIDEELVISLRKPLLEVDVEVDAAALYEAEAEALSSLVRAVLHTILNEKEVEQYWEQELFFIPLSSLFKRS